MSNIKALFFLLFLFVISGCGEVSNNVFTDNQICMATVSATMRRDLSIIKVDSVNNGIINLTYVRPSDQTIWKTRCKLNGNEVIWATDTGRWRTSQHDPIIRYSESGNLLTITQVYYDGSEGYTRFDLSQFQ